MTIIDQNTDRRALEIAAIFDCGFDLALVEKASDNDLRDMIIDWIEVGDECAAA